MERHHLLQPTFSSKGNDLRAVFGTAIKDRQRTSSCVHLLVKFTLERGLKAAILATCRDRPSYADFRPRVTRDDVTRLLGDV
ncbi:unnamed protein product [Colias eurytheme]|nr:unnamed protein product [Colias eurytheme]